MTRGRSGFYRRRDGKEGLWFAASDVETMMEDVLRKAGSFPTDEQPAVNIERLIERLGVHLDQHASLDAAVLGLTEFHRDRPPRILVHRDLTGVIDDDNTPPGVRGRWRATLAHEASHVIMHRVLFEVNRDQETLFPTEEQPESQCLMRCLKKNVLFRGGGANDWREVQANMGMAALLMPQSLFRRLAAGVEEARHLSEEALRAGSAAAATLTAEMATLFDVSKQAAGIRLQSLRILSPEGQPWLLHGAP